MSLVAGLSGAALAAGLVLGGMALRRTPVRPPLRLPAIRWGRAAAPLSAVALVGLITRWPVAAALAGVGVAFLPTLVGPDPESAAVARAEAVASWTEMLADTMAASAGLTQAIVVTAARAPGPIRAQVQALSARLAARLTLEEALRAFAGELADPSGDLVAAALITSARGQGARVGEVLTDLAVAAREEVAMRGRIAASRARVRSGIRVVAGFSVGFGLFLLVVAHSYLAPFGTPGGEMVLAAVGAFYAAGLWLMVGMARPRSVPRLLMEERS